MTSPPTSAASKKPRLRWFQFSVRTLLVVMLLVGCGLGWLIHDVREKEAVVRMIEQLDGRVEFGEPSFLGRWGVVRSLFGEHTFSPIEGIAIGPKTTDAHLLPFRNLKNLSGLRILSNQVTDLSPLSGLRELNVLILIETSVSDLSPLAAMSALATLHLRDTPVSDLSPLSGLGGLTSLDLRDTPVSDLSSLAGLGKLQAIYLKRDQDVRIPETLENVIQRF